MSINYSLYTQIAQHMLLELLIDIRFSNWESIDFSQLDLQHKI